MIVFLYSEGYGLMPKPQEIAPTQLQTDKYSEGIIVKLADVAEGAYDIVKMAEKDDNDAVEV
jgi:hypothetical protein